MTVSHINKPAIMVDIETLGTVPGSVITSIAACAWFPHNGNIFDEFKVNISIKSAVRYGLTLDSDSVVWWLKQDMAAKNAFLRAPISLMDALDNFSAWFMKHDKAEPGIAIWGHGATFDVPLLAVAYDKIEGKVPWHYRAPRDTRTLFALAGYEPAKTHLEHDALEDAKAQCSWVTEALRILRAPA